MFRILLAVAALLAVLAWMVVLLAPSAVAGLDPFLLGEPALVEASGASPESEPNSVPLAPATALTVVWAVAVLAIGVVLIVRKPRRRR